MIESHDPGHYNWAHFFKQSAIAVGCNFFVEIHDFIISIVTFGCEGIISFLPTCSCCQGLERQLLVRKKAAYHWHFQTLCLATWFKMQIHSLHDPQSLEFTIRSNWTGSGATCVPRSGMLQDVQTILCIHSLVWNFYECCKHFHHLLWQQFGFQAPFLPCFLWYSWFLPRWVSLAGLRPVQMCDTRDSR